MSVNMKKKISFLGALASVAMLSAPAANAYLIFGEDLNNSGAVPLASTPNSTTASNNFLANLIGVGTETFESQATGASAPLPLTFPGAGTATLTGGSGVVSAVTPGTTNGVGRYSIPSASSSSSGKWTPVFRAILILTLARLSQHWASSASISAISAGSFNSRCQTGTC